MSSNFVQILIEKGQALMDTEYVPIEFTKIPEADVLLNDLEHYPHAYVLACVMDRQIKAEKAWIIPYEISKELGGFDFRLLTQKDEQFYLNLFEDKKLHRFNSTMATAFHLAVQNIMNDYNSDASQIWKDNPSSAAVVNRFLKFHGVGVKIATMAANILAREFKVPLSDYLCIDISPDVQVKRVFQRLGLITNKVSNDELIYTARELYPQYPGIFDLSCWEIGRNWCRPKKPLCSDCSLEESCPKVISEG